MSSTEHSLEPTMRGRRFRAALVGVVAAPRLAVYLSCTVAVLVTNYLLGKEMMWDTLDYHLYAGFSALHDRFSQDYFPAGPQSYFNPYVYVPFYLLVRSGLPALFATSALAAAQSAILWLTYELAFEFTPAGDRRIGAKIGICAVLLAFLNPVLLNQFGSSYADITTGEVVFGGWLLLAGAIRTHNSTRIISAGLLLGLASALKPTNSVHALSAFAMLPFLPGTFREKIRQALIFGTAAALAFLVVAAPWAIRLEHHFGNPMFPLLNGLFRSPQFTTGPMADRRYIPDSLAQALWRPFAIVAPVTMVDCEVPSPDLRYALLLVLGILALFRLGWLRVRRKAVAAVSSAPVPRGIAALSCGFVVDWTLWLTASGNGRYFIPMSCVAAVLATWLSFWLFDDWPRLRNYLLAAALGAQVVQLAIGTGFRNNTRWDGGPWFEVSVPEPLAMKPNLYFAYGEPSNSFVAPFLASGSGIINIGGVYELGAQGENGERVKALIRKYWPHLRLFMHDERTGAASAVGVPDLTRVNGQLQAFGLRADLTDCSRIAVGDVGPAGGGVPAFGTGYLESCGVVAGPRPSAALLAGERAADVVFDRLEQACPTLFYPPHPVTQNFSGGPAQVWVRRYPDTGLSVYIGPGGVQMTFGDRGGTPDYLGRESDWEKRPLRLTCGRRDERYYAKILPGQY